MRDLTSIGIGLLVAGVVAMVIEAVLAGVWTVRLSGRARMLNQRLLQEQMQLRADLGRLQVSMAETAVLWQPYRRIWRWLRHPLTIALVQSYARRRAAAR